ncbi:MAG: SURF1 family protein [Paracoccaceae bacterium]|nr:SURF1 family protein [Paracoccaceae bacterium]
MRKYIFPLIIGLAGTGVLASLGIWQLQRLAWKEGILAEMDALLAGEPRTLREATEPNLIRFAPVRVSGRTTGDEIHVLQATRQGAGYRLISAFETRDGPRILLDEGFITSGAKEEDRPPRVLTIIGNLHVPDDVNSATPAPDRAANIWYGRDVDEMAGALGADAAYVVVRSVEVGERVAEPLALDTAGIPNNHLGYAVQWFGLAIVWAGMTLFLLWRIRKRTV